MKIEVHASQKFSAYEQFDPLTLKTVQFFDMGCLGGAVKIRTSDSWSHFTCTACGEIGLVSDVECRAAVRRLLISGKPQKLKKFEFVVREKPLTSPSAT